MSKIKNYKTNLIDQLQNVAAKAGFVLMASAAVLGSVELTDGRERVVLAQPAQVFASMNDVTSNPNDTLRREKEEVGVHNISYGVSMRTPSRTGKQ